METREVAAHLGLLGQVRHVDAERLVSQIFVAPAVAADHGQQKEARCACEGDKKRLPDLPVSRLALEEPTAPLRVQIRK